MSHTKNADTLKTRFSSKAFPTTEDMALWNSLRPDEQRAIIQQDEQDAFDSGLASHEPLEARLARVRAGA